MAIMTVGLTKDTAAPFVNAVTSVTIVLL